MRNVLPLLAVLFSATLSAQPPSYPPQFPGAKEETYKKVGDVELKLSIFQPPEHDVAEPRPAIIFFFGGGWKAGTPAQFEQHCRYLASRGMVAITADYRVRNRHQTLADKCVADAKSAVRWVRENAKRLGVDPDRIVAGGGSAGGHLAACTAVIVGMDEPDESANVSSKPNALALFNPALLLADFQDFTFDEEKLTDIATRTGVPPQQISPIHHIRAGLPPTIIFHGEADTTVPFETVRRYAETASSAGNRCELVGYDDATHGFFNFNRGGMPGQHYRLTVHRLDRFLESLGYLKGPPTIPVPDSDNVNLRGSLERSRKKFESQRAGTVAFLGGSITKMFGYRPLVEEALRERFPDTKFEFINAGISSTCSTTGAFRLSRDVLDQNPDLLFVEFAVNDDQDAAHEARECLRGMEGIVRHALRRHPDTNIVISHFVNPPMLKLLKQDEVPISLSQHEAVARHYGVSSVNVAREVADRHNARTLTWGQYGGTHPGPEGNRLAADMIVDLLNAAWSDPPVQSPEDASDRLPKPLDPGSYYQGRLVDAGAAQCDDDWTIGVPDWDSLPGSIRPRFAGRPLLHASQVGAELKLPFDGTAVGAFLLAGPDAAEVEYSVDGGSSQSVDLYHRFSRGLHYPRTVMFGVDLAPGPHVLTLRILGSENPASSGTAVRILDFAVH